MIVDLHAHILPGIDDGAENPEMALEMLRIAQADGITHMVATPHYIHGSMNNHAELVRSKCRELADAGREAGINVHVYPGNEVFLGPETPQLIQEGRICGLNDSSYVLVELPMMSIPNYASEIFYRIKLAGWTPVLAHPERNIKIAEDPNILYEYIQMGVLSQVNSTSFTGIYGKKIRNVALTLLRHGMVHIISSDAHTCRGRSPKLRGCRDLIAKEAGERNADMLFENNGMAVIKDKAFGVMEPEKVKKHKHFLLSFFRRSNG